MIKIDYDKAFELLLLYTAKLYGKSITKEYTFQKGRKWRFDYAVEDSLVAFEYEGGIWTKGRHTNPIGYANDAEKYNSATIAGWRVFRFTPCDLEEPKEVRKKHRARGRRVSKSIHINNTIKLLENIFEKYCNLKTNMV